MHLKTSLISMHLELKELERFELGQDDPELVAKRCGKRGNEFKLVSADGSELFKAVVEWCRS
jgi:hypothetical protein